MHSVIRTWLSIMLVILMLTLQLHPIHVQAQSAESSGDAWFEFRPHCSRADGDGNADWLFGPIPAPGIVVETGPGNVRCSRFEIHDPQTLKTERLRKGDILDVDILVENPSEQNLHRVRAWLSYDPNVLEGISVDITEDLPLVTPDENDFFPEEGYIKLDASAEEPGPDDERLVFARLQFRVKKGVEGGSPISFYDAQNGGKSAVYAQKEAEKQYILKKEPGVLLVLFDKEDAMNTRSDQHEETDVLSDQEEIDPNACTRNDDCPSGLCIAGQCQEAQQAMPNGSSCTFDQQCQSGLCTSGICIPKLAEQNEKDDLPLEPTKTAFGLLQVRNVRVTTDGTSAFLAWDHLRSSALKAYNVYYGTTSGRYIQRKTVDRSQNSITIRSLPIGTTYYFAVRAVSAQDEESAFSREVAATIGDPDSSTAPLVQGIFTDAEGRNPLEARVDTAPAVPGETGVPTLLMLILISSAVIGTVLASRRQCIVQHPQS